MVIAHSIIDNVNIPNDAIHNLEALPHGTGCAYLLVITGQYDNEYIAKRWMRKLPNSVHQNERIVRF